MSTTAVTTTMARPTVVRGERQRYDGTLDDAAGRIGGANPFVGLSARDVSGAVGRWARHLVTEPVVAADHALRLSGGLLRVAAGSASVEPDRGDRRFTDPAFTENPLYRRLLQAYLVWRGELLATVDELALDEKSADRARFGLSLVTEALAPTNALAGNPAAIKRAFDTGGLSLLRGARNLLGDLRNNGGMPSTVDRRPFKLGSTVAATPGAVVFGNEVLELLQYLPATTTIRSRPTLVVPPQINKFWILDASPGRSFVEYAVAHGIPFFVISWRNPGPEQRDWGLDTYITAALEAIDATREISGSDDVNVLSMCAGGLTAASLLGHLAATGDTRVNAAALAVTALDVSVRSQMNLFATRPTIAAARRSSARRGVLPGSDLMRVFAWLRPNDLIWNYWVNNYLMGEQPPAFDILAWNADTTNLPARLHGDFLNMFLENPMVRPGTMTALGTPVDLGAVTCDIYAIGALTDHIVPWESAHRATQLFGGQTRFVLSSSGHVQAIVNPPGNPKARYFVNDDAVADPRAWLDGATETRGTWWDDWVAWTLERSGPERPAPRRAGSRRHPALAPAPGTYVLE